jgi:hypothetical protein
MAQTITKRLIVVIDDCQANDQDLAHAVYWLACQENQAVLYLVLVADRENQMAVFRDMTTMKAITAANRLQVDVSLVEKNEWLNGLRNIVCPGDLIICQQEHTFASSLSQPTSISEYLSSNLMVPVHTISGFYHPRQECVKKQVPEFVSLLGYLVILATFTWLQVKLDLLLNGWVQTVLILTAFCIEMGAVWIWNKYTY